VPPTTPGSPTRSVQANGVRLTWTASTDPQPGVITYEIVRNDRVIATGLGGLGHTDATGTAADRYVIRAVDAAGNRSASTVRLGG
jgi:endoglucanase